MRAGLVIALLCVGCGSGSAQTRAPSASDPTPWSRAGRRARVRHAWHCTGQGTQPLMVSGAGGPRPTVVPKREGVVVNPRSGIPRSDCDYLPYLCAEVARGHQAWDTERAACAPRGGHVD